LPKTVGCFRLNAELPIPSPGRRMEVDLLSAESQIAIELDGGQHLAVAEAYRRDRRKDVLLQAAPLLQGLQGLQGRTDIMCCGFCAKMLASASMRFWMPSSLRCRIDVRGE